MCNISKAIADRATEKGLEKGKDDGMLFSIHSLMETMKFSAEQAMKALRIPESDYKKYMAMLQNKA